MLNMVSLLTLIHLSKVRSLTTTNHHRKALPPTLIILDAGKLLDLISIHLPHLQARRKKLLMHHLVNWVLKLSISKDRILAGLEPRNMAMGTING
jgi:hypothetical protein